jgi:hypothetical protein
MKNGVLFTCVISLLIASCSQSVLYNPAISLPVKPLNERELQVQGSLGFLPETRPELLTGNPFTYAGCFQVGYGFSNKFAMNLSGWQDFEYREFSSPDVYRLRYGFSISGLMSKPVSEKQSLIYIPRVGVAFNNRMISGYGLGFSTGLHHKVNDKLGIYGAAGVVYGFEQMGKIENDEKELKSPSGLGIILNLGLSGVIYKNFSINFELSPIYSMNFFDNKRHFVASPQLGIAYLINTNAKG